MISEKSLTESRNPEAETIPSLFSEIPARKEFYLKSIGLKLGKRMNQKLAFLLAILFAFSPVLAEGERTLLIVGTAKVAAPAELIELRIGVETEAKTAEEAHERTVKKAEALVKILKSQPLLSIQTASVELHPVYDYSKNSQRQIKAYTASNIVSIRSKIENAGKLIDESVQSGANQILGIRLLATDANAEKASHEALQLAAKDAKKKAEQILAALGLKFKEVIEIHADSIQDPEPVRGMLAARTKEQSTPIEGGNIFLEARVTLKISY